MEAESIIGLVLSALGGGGLVAIVKLIINKRPVTVRGELQIVTATLEHNQTLRTDLDRAIVRIGAMELALNEVRQENMSLHRSIANIEVENRILRDRCDHLEQENARLKG